MAGTCKFCGFSGSQEAIEKHASECPRMFDEPDIIETRWGDFVTVKDPRIDREVSGLVVSCYPNHVTINPGKNSPRLKVHRGHVVSRKKGFSWSEEDA